MYRYVFKFASETCRESITPHTLCILQRRESPRVDSWGPGKKINTTRYYVPAAPARRDGKAWTPVQPTPSSPRNVVRRSNVQCERRFLFSFFFFFWRVFAIKRTRARMTCKGIEIGRSHTLREIAFSFRLTARSIWRRDEVSEKKNRFEFVVWCTTYVL